MVLEDGKANLRFTLHVHPVDNSAIEIISNVRHVKAHAAFFGHVFEARGRDVNGEVFEVLPDVTEIGSRYAVILQRANEALFGFVLTWDEF